MDIEDLIRQVKRNCDIADAQSWGYYSICGLLLRLRSLYQEERRLKPWEPIPGDALGEWISAKEKGWESLSDEEPRPLIIDGEPYDPFQVSEINVLLRNHGLVYGAGYALFNKPTFFLAALERTREEYDYQIFYLGREFCTDLASRPAMLQGRCIFIRLAQVDELLWQKFSELSSRRLKGILGEAFLSFGIHPGMPLDDAIGKFGAIRSELVELLVHHEIGEAVEDEGHDDWLSLLGRETDKWTELHLRAIKDLIADTSDKGTLKFITDDRNKALLFLCSALLPGIEREIFPEMMNAVQRFSENGDWSLIEETRILGHRKACRLRNSVLSLGRSGTIKEHLESVKKAGWLTGLLV